MQENASAVYSDIENFVVSENKIKLKSVIYINIHFLLTHVRYHKNTFAEAVI